jgi:PAS domain S-box-containing protein
VLITAAFSLCIYKKINDKSAELRDEIQPNIIAMTQLYNALVDLDRWGMSYAFAGQDEQRKKVQSAIERLETISLEHVEHEKSYGGIKQVMAENIMAKVNRYTLTMTEIGNLREQGLDASEILRAKAAEYHSALSTLLGELAEYRTFLMGQLTIAQEVLDRQRALGAEIISLGAIVITCLVSAIAFAVTKSIVQPIRLLHKGVKIIGEGDLDYRIGLETEDEFGQLSRAFDKMTESLRSTTVSVDLLNKEIADRKRAEDSLKESEEKYQGLYESSRDAILLLRPDEGIFDLNPAALQLFGCTDRAGLISKNPPDLSPEYQPGGIRSSEKAQQMIAIAMRNGSHFFEWVHRRSDGTEFSATVLLSRVDLRDKTILQATVRDVTDRIEVERKLGEAKQQAEAASRAKSQFLANVSHEIRTPLNAIIGVSKMLSTRDTGNLTANQREGLEIVRQSGERLLGLINDVLDMSKIESGRMELKLESLSVDVLIAGIRSMTLTLIGDKKICFSVEKSAHVPANIVSDAQKLHAILTNIVSNAVKFTEEGKVALGVYVDQGRLYFSVSDTGIGIEKGEMDRIFEEFTQVTRSTTAKYPGTGLGLAISKRMVELLDGRIWAESAPGKGTTVAFFVPLKAPRAPESEQAAGRPEERTKQSHGVPQPSRDVAEPVPIELRPKVLIAEDDKYGRAAIRMMLERRYRLIFAKDGREAVEKFFADSPDVTLMDIMMPVMDGYEALREILKKSPVGTVPIIALTAKAMTDEREELLACGFTDYVSKPIDDEILVGIIEKYLPRNG